MNSLDYASAALLGVVQGLTEFLPISSSGHLVLAQRILGVDPPGVLLEVALHVGTLLAVLLYFRGDVAALLAAVPGALGDVIRGRLPSGAPGKTLVALVVGTIPAVVVAVVAKEAIENAFQSVETTLAGLAVTGVILRFSRFAGERRARIGARKGLLIGVAQALAILPGISRSGSTITAGILAGLARTEAARFSFLLSIPAILGATILSVPDLLEAIGSAAPSPAGGLGAPLALGVLAAFVSGLAALRLILFVAGKNRLGLFSWYLWIVAAAGFLALR